MLRNLDALQPIADSNYRIRLFSNNIILTSFRQVAHVMSSRQHQIASCSSVYGFSRWFFFCWPDLQRDQNALPAENDSFVMASLVPGLGAWMPSLLLSRPHGTFILFMFSNHIR